MFKTLVLLSFSLPTLAMADVKVGVIVGATGPGASLGIPYKNTFSILPKTLGGEKVEYIILDDGTDPTSAVKNAKKLVLEDKVDLIIGSTSVPTALSVVDVANENKTPQISISPLPGSNGKSAWAFSVPQSMTIMMKANLDHMKLNGVKTVAFIGFADALGDQLFNGFAPQAEAAGLKIVANERYARTDTSVVGQVLKVLATKPDAILLGGSGTPGALPHITLIERGYKGPIYQNHAVVNKDFLRVGGKSVEGAIVPTGPVIVADQLPDSNPTKKVSLQYIKAYEGMFGPGSSNAFSAYSYDAYLLADRAVAIALKKAKPGTPEFREAIRDALESTKELVGTHGVYSMTKTDHTGVDSRAVVLVRIENAGWKLIK